MVLVKITLYKAILLAFYVHGDLTEYGKEGAEPNSFLLGYDPLTRACCSVLQYPLNSQPSHSDSALYCWLVIHLLCKALCFTRDILLSTYPDQYPIHSRNLSMNEESQLWDGVRSGLRRPTCTWEV